MGKTIVYRLFFTISILALLLSNGCSSSSSPTAPTAYGFSAEEVEFFDEVKFIDLGNTYLVKWVSDVRIKVHGNANSTDMNVLNSVIGEINGLITKDGIQLRIVESGQNVNIYIQNSPPFEIPRGHYSGYTVWWYDSMYRITNAEVWIDTTERQSWRNGTIRHELLHVLGFGHTRRGDSAFNLNKTHQRFTPLDKSAIRMLHLPGIEPGMHKDQALALLGRETTPALVASTSKDESKDYKSIKRR